MSKKNEISNDPYGAFRALVYGTDVGHAARMLGVKKGTLYNKADADIESQAQPTLRDLILSAQGYDDYRVLDALDEMFGRVAIDLRSHQHQSDEALLELLTALGKENGEFHAALLDALQGKKFTREGMNLIRAEAFDLVRAAMTLLHRVEGLVDD